MTSHEKWSSLNLMPDALQMARELDAVLVKPFHQLGVQGAREVVDVMHPSERTPIDSVENFVIPGSHGNIPVRLYLPSCEPNLPVIVYFHGGGWTLGTPP
uniref:alpha/beta hydrolase n=1 Tax=Rhodococcus qingshengii TaxID=334542 RepID=UPI001C4E1509|nr:alpha/beta hydrolase [Rhodococcus qingshengii]